MTMSRQTQKRLRPQDWSLGNKAAVLFAVYGLVMLVSITMFAYADGRDRAWALTRERLNGLTLAAESQVHEFVEAIKQDTLTQANSTAIRALISARALGDEALMAQARADLEATLIAHAQSRPYVYQARVIDAKTGDEMVRIQRDTQFGQLRSEPLQNKANRDYFSEMLAGEPGKFYASSINLNREHGRIERPFRPTIRFGRVLVDADGNPDLMIVVNVGFRHLVFRLRRLFGKDADLMLFDDVGRVLAHPRRELAFDFETGPGTTLADLYGPTAMLQLREDADTDVDADRQAMVVGGGNLMIGLRRVALHAQAAHTIIVGAGRDPARYMAGLWTVVEKSWMLASAFLLVGSLLFGLVGRVMLRPVSRLVGQIDTYEPWLGGAKPGRRMLDRRDEFGALARGIYGMALRMEAQMRAAKSARDEMRGVFQCAGDAIVLIDQDGLIEDANAAAEKLFRWSRDELLGRRASILLVPEDRILSREKLAGHDRERTDRLTDSGHQFQAVQRDGTRLPVAVSLSQTGSDRSRRYVAIFHDMSHVTALEAARAANMAKSRFLANMSHELRTPLNAVVLHAEMISDEAQEADNAQLIEDATNIKSAARHLLDLINGILDLARIEAGRTELAPEEFDLDTFLSELRSMAQALAVAKGNTVQVLRKGLPAKINGDRVKLRQCLLNLISNAAKFTEKGGITIEMDHRSDRLLMAVADTGIGMTQEQTGRIFEVFEQAHGYIHGQFGGSGVGLALTRSILELMGGTISVESTLGSGTRFEIIVPLENEQQHPDTADSVVPMSKGPLVLLIDADTDSRATRVTVLEKAGIRVVCATTLQQASHQARLHRPDVLVMDIGRDDVDDMDGFEAALRSDADTGAIPILRMTDNPEGGVVQLVGPRGRMLALGTDADLIKALKACLDRDGDRVVMVVEDDEAMRRAITRGLERAGLPAVMYENGDDVLRYLQRHSPVAVLLDLTLPGANGFEIIKVMQQSPTLAKVPVFVITGMDLTVEEEQWLAERTRLLVRKGAMDFDAVVAALEAEISASDIARSQSIDSGNGAAGSGPSQDLAGLLRAVAE